MSIYINQKPKYCTYLTIYIGDLLPPFYIGSTSVAKIQNKKKPYHGSVCSKKYGPTWKQELKDNPHLFKTIILERYFSRKNAFLNEQLLHIEFNVVKSTQFINLVVARTKFGGLDQSGENNHMSKRTGKNNFRSILIVIDGVEYCSKTEAMQQLKLNQPQLNKLLNGINPFAKHNLTPEHKHKISTYGKGRKQSKSHIQNRAIARTGKNHERSIPITINGITYPSRRQAKLALNVSTYYINKFITS